MYRQITMILLLSIIYNGCVSSEGIYVSKDKIKLIRQKSYNLGYRMAIEDASEIYIQKGLELAKESIKKWRDRILAIEAGKYAIEEEKVTAPEIYVSQSTDGSITMNVTGCKIEKENTPAEIIDFYYKNTHLIK